MVSILAVDSRLVNLILFEPDCSAKDALALVNTLAVDSKLVSLIELEPESEAKLADAFSSVTSLVDTELENGVNVESVITGLSLTLKLPVIVTLPVN